MDAGLRLSLPTERFCLLKPGKLTSKNGIRNSLQPPPTPRFFFILNLCLQGACLLAPHFVRLYLSQILLFQMLARTSQEKAKVPQVLPIFSLIPCSSAHVNGTSYGMEFQLLDNGMKL